MSRILTNRHYFAPKESVVIRPIQCSRRDLIQRNQNYQDPTRTEKKTAPTKKILKENSTCDLKTIYNNLTVVQMTFKRHCIYWIKHHSTIILSNRKTILPMTCMPLKAKPFSSHYVFYLIKGDHFNARDTWSPVILNKHIKVKVGVLRPVQQPVNKHINFCFIDATIHYIKLSIRVFYKYIHYNKL